MFMAATHTTTTAPEGQKEATMAASITTTSTIWTKSAVGGTEFRFEGSTKFVRFPEVTIGGVVIPELIITQEG